MLTNKEFGSWGENVKLPPPPPQKCPLKFGILQIILGELFCPPCILFMFLLNLIISDEIGHVLNILNIDQYSVHSGPDFQKYLGT